MKSSWTEYNKQQRADSTFRITELSILYMFSFLLTAHFCNNFNLLPYLSWCILKKYFLKKFFLCQCAYTKHLGRICKNKYILGSVSKILKLHVLNHKQILLFRLTKSTNLKVLIFILIINPLLHMRNKTFLTRLFS